MRKLFFLAMVLTIIACKEEPKDYAVISGEISHYDGIKNLTIRSTDGKLTKEIKISSDGNFTDTLNIGSQSYMLYDNTNRVLLYLNKADNISINYDFKNFKNTISITGKGSAANNYLIQKDEVLRKTFGSAKDVYSLNEIDFKEKTKAIKKATDSVLNNIEGVASDFITKEMRNTHYFYLRLLTDYEAAHKHFTKNNDFKVSDDFFKRINRFRL